MYLVRCNMAFDASFCMRFQIYFESVHSLVRFERYDIIRLLFAVCGRIFSLTRSSGIPFLSHRFSICETSLAWIPDKFRVGQAFSSANPSGILYRCSEEEWPFAASQVWALDEARHFCRLWLTLQKRCLLHCWMLLSPSLRFLLCWWSYLLAVRERAST